MITSVVGCHTTEQFHPNVLFIYAKASEHEIVISVYIRRTIDSTAGNDGIYQWKYFQIREDFSSIRTAFN